MSFFKNKIVRIIAIVMALFIGVMLLSKVRDNPIGRIAYGVVSPIYSGMDKVISPTRKFFSHVKNANKYEKEIEALKKENNELKLANRGSKEYIEENNRLKELLDLKEGMASTKTVTAKVVSYEPNSWYNTVMLNKGETSGIKKGDVVVTTLGLVGKVTDLGSNWAKVSTILNISNSVGVKLSRTGDVGVVSGDANLAENKECKLEYLSNDKGLIKGDILLTSGLGGIYPPDLLVGKVKEINSDSTGNLEYASVTTSVDFSSLYEVLVITYHE